MGCCNDLFGVWSQTLQRHVLYISETYNILMKNSVLGDLSFKMWIMIVIACLLSNATLATTHNALFELSHCAISTPDICHIQNNFRLC